MKIFVINGPNINMLGIREPEIYGKASYSELVEYIKKEKGGQHELIFVQSNHEGDLVDALQRAYFEKADGVVINPGAYAHTSIAIMDAAKAIGIPVAEVHISDLTAREDFRKISYIRKAAYTTVCGMGFAGYIEAIERLEKRSSL